MLSASCHDTLGICCTSADFGRPSQQTIQMPRQRTTNGAGEAHNMAAPPITIPALKLPENVLALVVAKLPLLYMFSLRMVCRQWNATFRDTRFLKNCFQPARREPLCLWHGVDSSDFEVYGLKTGTWKSWDQTFVMVMEPESLDNSPRSVSFVGDDNSYRVFGDGEDGLLLVETIVGSKRCLYLVNPMTRSSRMLPGTCLKLSIFGMVLDESSNSHKIFAVEYQCYKGQKCSHYGALDPGSSESPSDDESDDASDDESNGDYRISVQVNVYDLKLESWKRTGEWKGFVWYFDRPVFHQDIFYCLTTKYRWNQPYREVHCFDGEKWWHQRKMGRIPLGLRFAHMFKFDGNLMLVGGKGRGTQLSSVQVWKLNEETKKWIEITTMPEDLLDGFCLYGRIPHKNFCCHSLEGFICLIGRSRNIGRLRIIMCNLWSSSWWEARDFDYDGILYSRRDRYHSLFLLKPNFDKTF